MTDRKSIWQMVRDVRDARDFDARQLLDRADAGPFAANTGDVLYAALAAIGVHAPIQGGAYPCETDYLAARGATFPADVPVERLVAFNRATLREVMTEADEMRRYAMIASFFRRTA